MNAKQEVKLGMYNVIVSSLDAQLQTVEQFSAFHTAYLRFKIKVNTIHIVAQQEDLIISGLALDKTQIKKNVVIMAADIAALIYSFAVEVNDPLLMNEVNYSVSKLRTTKDDQLPIRLKNIHDRGVAHLPALQEYGINATLLATFSEMIEAYKEKVPNPRRGISTKKGIKANLVVLFKETDTILKLQLDKRVVALKTQYPDFVANYKSNRILIDAAKTTTQFKGTVTRVTDGMAIANATVKLDDTAFETVTDSNGAFVIKEIPFGSYTTTATSEGHASIDALPVLIKRGQINKIKFSLTPTAE
jgi:hypothetical protein